MKQIIPSSEKFAQWVEYDTNGGCWLWAGSENTDGYGKMTMGSRIKVAAHREMWRMTFGDIPPGVVVCHKCDVPRCVNPNHLFLGTNKDNCDDKFAKGRYRSGVVFDPVRDSIILANPTMSARQLAILANCKRATVAARRRALTQPPSPDLQGRE